MKGTLAKQEGSPRGDPWPGDYYTIETHLDVYFVNDETAVRMGAVLARRFRPRFTRFVDLWGRRVWLRTDKIEAISESTGAQRERDRAFRYAQRRESRADRRWDDD